MIMADIQKIFALVVSNCSNLIGPLVMKQSSFCYTKLVDHLNKLQHRQWTLRFTSEMTKIDCEIDNYLPIIDSIIEKLR